MNLTECKRMLKYLEKGELEVLKAYLEDQEQECIIKNEKSKEKPAVEAVHKFRNEDKSIFFPTEDGKFILACYHSIYVLNSDRLIKAYNEMISNRKRCSVKDLTFDDLDMENDFMREAVKKYLQAVKSFSKKQFQEIGTIGKIEEPSKMRKTPRVLLEISTKDALVTHTFYKSVVDYASHILGKDVVFSMDKKSPLLYGESEKGKAYILGKHPKKEEQEEQQ